MSHLAQSVTVVWLWNVCELRVARWQQKMQVFFICLPLLTPLPANAGRDRQQQQAKRASMCVRVCVVLYVFCYSVRKIRSLLLILFSVTHLRMNGEVGGRLFDWRFLQLHNQCVRAWNASPSTSQSAAATAAADCARVIYMCGCIDETIVRLSLCVWVCVDVCVGVFWVNESDINTYK